MNITEFILNALEFFQGLHLFLFYTFTNVHDRFLGMHLNAEDRLRVRVDLCLVI